MLWGTSLSMYMYIYDCRLVYSGWGSEISGWGKESNGWGRETNRALARFFAGTLR